MLHHVNVLNSYSCSTSSHGSHDARLHVSSELAPPERPALFTSKARTSPYKKCVATNVNSRFGIFVQCVSPYFSINKRFNPVCRDLPEVPRIPQWAVVTGRIR